MKKIRPIIAAIIAIFFYTFTDILVWQRVFEANKLVAYADAYHTGWFVTLAGYATIGIILMWDMWKECLYFLWHCSLAHLADWKIYCIMFLTRGPCRHLYPG